MRKKILIAVVSLIMVLGSVMPVYGRPESAPSQPEHAVVVPMPGAGGIFQPFGPGGGGPATMPF